MNRKQRRATRQNEKVSPKTTALPDWVSQVFSEAVLLHQAGDLSEAEKIYRRILQEFPNHSDSLHFLGVIAHQVGQHEAAADLISRALVLDDGHFDAWDNLGSVWAALGRLEDAAICHRQAISLQPESATAHYNLGNALLAAGDNSGAATAYREAVRLRPDYVKALYNLGHAYTALGRIDEAEAVYRQLLQIDPNYVDACVNLGSLLSRQGRLDEAVRWHRRVLSLRPNDPVTSFNLGAALQQKNFLEEAEIHYRRAVQIDPTYVEALDNLGSVLRALKRPDRAEACHREALKIRPDFAEAHYNLGNVLQTLNRDLEAEACFDRALALKSDLIPAHFNRSLTHLSRGLLDVGWIGHEWRFQAGDAIPNRWASLKCSAWKGEPLNGRRLLIWREQGVGDEMMFATCYEDLRRRIGKDGECVIECDPRLVSLFARSFPWATVRGQTIENRMAEDRVVDDLGRERIVEHPIERIDPPDVACHCPAGSLPHILRPRLAAFANDAVSTSAPEAEEEPSVVRAGALRLDAERVALWRRRLEALGPEPKVGICWRSRLMTEERRDAYLRLDQWRAVLQCPGVRFVNLQYDQCEAELTAIEALTDIRIARWSGVDMMNDFETTAALISCLDLVISAPTSVGEMSGLLGTPVWRVIGGFDWTMLGARVRPWFPSMRVFQADRDEPLIRVLEIVARALAAQVRLYGSATKEENASKKKEAQKSPPSLGPYNGSDIRSSSPTLMKNAPNVSQKETLKPKDLKASPLLKQKISVQDAEKIMNDAFARHRAGDFEGAERLYQRVLSARADHFDALHLSGLLAYQAGRFDEAIVRIQRALEIDCRYAKAYNHLGLALQAAGRSEEALAGFDRAVALDANFADGWSNRGQLLKELQRYDEAEASHRRALAIDPNMTPALLNLGAVMEARGDFAEAYKCYQRVLSLAPERPEPHNNIGMELQRRNQYDAALASFEHALILKPDYPLARWNRGLLLLERGRLIEGWADLESRFGPPPLQRGRSLPVPTWRGEPLNGRRLLVWCEQGVGDEILFASCYHELSKLDGKVVFECDRRLVSLLTRSFPWAEARAETTDAMGRETLSPSDVDLQIAAGSLPRLFRSRLIDFSMRKNAEQWEKPGKEREKKATPLPEPAYLQPDPERLALWRRRTAALGSGLKIGICWRSQLVTVHRRTAYTRLEQWRDILTLPGVHWVNLQYDRCEEEVAAAEAAFGIKIARWPDIDLKNDLEAAAALTASLDLVITAPTAVSEMAGALGIPVWRTTERGEWTLLGTRSRPWYPTMRLYWFETAVDQQFTLSQIARDLRLLMAQTGEAKYKFKEEAESLETSASAREALLERAIADHQAGRKDEAERAYQALLRIVPDQPTALHLYGLSRHQRGDNETAALWIERAVAAAPDYSAALNNLGSIYQVLGRLDEAERCFRRVLEMKPDIPDVLTNLGNVLELQNRLDEAEACQRRAVALAPEQPEAAANLGVVLWRLGRLKDAEEALQRALALRPDHVPALNALGTVLRQQGQAAAAAELHHRALALGTTLAETRSELGLALKAQGRCDEAEAAWSDVLAKDPNHSAARFNIGLFQLRRGDVDLGWEGYDRRFDDRQFQSARRWPDRPIWDGRLLAKRRIFVWREQGVGDELMFASCYPTLIRLAGHCLIECDSRLVTLFRRSFPQATIHRESLDQNGLETISPTLFDEHCPAGSLPRRLRPTLSYFSERRGFLVPDPERVLFWRERLARLGEGIRIGVCWRSGLMTGERRRIYTQLKEWSALLRCPGVRFVNLQYDDCETEIVAAERCFGASIARWSDLDMKNDFEGTAALISGLDLVVTAPTAVGELAGALGVPVWRFGFDDEWTLLGAVIRPWFPTMEMFLIKSGDGETFRDILERMARRLMLGLKK
ncbi:protein O-GlcNAc transferase [Azospirillaceae bacterium]